MFSLKSLKTGFYNIRSFYSVLKNGALFYVKNDRPRNMGEQIVILGNGPDADIYIKNIDKFINYDLLTVNFFPLQKALFLKLKPRYLCLMDPAFFDYNLQIEPCLKNNIKELISILETVTWNLILVVPAGCNFPLANNKIKRIGLSNAIYTNKTTRFQAKLFYRNLILPMSYNVSSSALLFAEMFGYKNVALIGVNLDWMKDYVVDENNLLWIEDTHFYGKTRRIKNDTYLGQLKATYYTFWGFEQAKKLAEYNNISVFNYSGKSYLQMFMKRNL